MVYLLNAGFNPDHKATDLALMRMAVAIRSVVGFSKKVIFKAIREMRNGALHVSYWVDGIICSTFVKASSFAKLFDLAYAEVQQIKRSHCERLKAEFATQQVGVSFENEYIKISVPTSKGYASYYLTEGRNFRWECRVNKNSTPRVAFNSLKEAINYLLINPVY